MSNNNKMKELAMIFGLELGEEFNIKYNNGAYVEFTPHRFTEEGLIDKDGDGTHILSRLLQGDYTIEKLPFRPEEGQRYYTIGLGLKVIHHYWTRSNYDLERKLLGVVFSSEKEAVAYLPIHKKRLEGEEV